MERVGVIGVRLSCGGHAGGSPPPLGEGVGVGGGSPRRGTSFPPPPAPPPHPSPTRGEGVAAALPQLKLAPMRVGVRGPFPKLRFVERPPPPASRTGARARLP